MTTTPTDKPICFLVAPIGDVGSPIRRRSDQVLEIVEWALEGKYTALRADRIAAPGLINRQVIKHLLQDPLVIADLSGANPNVYYELAIRHTVGKPVIQVIQKGETLPFDIRDMRTLEIDTNTALEAVKLIKQSIEETERPGFEVETPISAARRDA